MKLGDIPVDRLIDICRDHHRCDECPLLKDDGVCQLLDLFTNKDMEVNIDAEDQS